MYEVYIAKLENSVVYIGKGKIGRHRHLKSGKSSCVEANKEFFSDNKLRVEVHSTYSKDREALLVEKQLIQELKPLWNKTEGVKVDPVEDLIESYSGDGFRYKINFKHKVNEMYPLFRWKNTKEDSVYMSWLVEEFNTGEDIVKKAIRRIKRRRGKQEELPYTETLHYMFSLIFHKHVRPDVKSKIEETIEYIGEGIYSTWKKNELNTIHKDIKSGHVRKGHILQEDALIGSNIYNKNKDVGGCTIIAKVSKISYAVLMHKTARVVVKKIETLLREDFNVDYYHFNRKFQKNFLLPTDFIFGSSDISLVGVIGARQEKLLNILLTGAYNNCLKNKNKTKLLRVLGIKD